MKFHNPLLFRLVPFALFLISSLAPCFAQDGNPRHPGVAHFSEIGSMSGAYINALPDIDGDSIPDFCIERSGQLYLYRGRKGSLPAESEGVRIGPTETQSATRFLAAGDWDGENGPDICVRIELANDTSFGNTGGRNQVFRVVIFWNQGEGQYDISDTTRLSSGYEASFGPLQGARIQVSGDSTESLCLHGSGRWIYNGSFSSFPRLYLYRGHNGARWGRAQIPNTPDWQWWNAPNVSRLGAEDLERDGHSDLILYSSQETATRTLSVLYGRSDGAPPDTIADLQQINMAPYGVRSEVFSDVSGDGIPEMNLLNPDVDQVKIYIGCKGQRLLEQFGSGNDPAHPEEKVWWGKPWASVKGPNLVSNAWFGFGLQLLDLGSADSDSIEEIWVPSSEFLLCYNVGGQVIDGIRYGLDSLFDGEILTDAATGVRLGDIDGSGRTTFALSHDGTLRFYHTVDQLPTPQETYWRVPQGKEVSSVELRMSRESGLHVRVEPNPSSGEVRIRWNPDNTKEESASVRVTDILGQEVTVFRVPSGSRQAIWDASETFGGTYFITVTVGDHTETVEVQIKG